jgi:hypothetical protein
MYFFGAQVTFQIYNNACDKTAFAKFKISNNFKQNIDETQTKQPKIHRKIHTSLWILKSPEKNLQTKSLETLPNEFQKIHALEHGFKNLQKSTV